MWWLLLINEESRSKLVWIIRLTLQEQIDHLHHTVLEIVAHFGKELVAVFKVQEESIPQMSHLSTGQINLFTFPADPAVLILSTPKGMIGTETALVICYKETLETVEEHIVGRCVWLPRRVREHSRNDQVRRRFRENPI
jgi:hypothetical protein